MVVELNRGKKLPHVVVNERIDEALGIDKISNIKKSNERKTYKLCRLLLENDLLSKFALTITLTLWLCLSENFPKCMFDPKRWLESRRQEVSHLLSGHALCPQFLPMGQFPMTQLELRYK
jgi:hypothetical protein